MQINFKLILGWSEAWALVIPVTVLLYKKKQPAYLKPVVIYTWLALVLNVFQDTIANLKTALHFPHWLQTNNYVYNIHSIVRFACFSMFFIGLHHPYFKTLKRIIPIFFYAFVIMNFVFFEAFFRFSPLSSRLLTTEAYLLLFYCILYYMYRLNYDTEQKIRQPHFWVVTGLCFYVAVGFFIFLFQNTLVKQLEHFAISIWRVHDIAYIIFCIMLAVAFAERGSKRVAVQHEVNTIH